MPVSPLTVALALSRAIDSANALLGRGVAWLSIALVALTCYVVLMRYAAGLGATAIQEAIMYAHALVFMGAAAWTLQRDGHVRVDIFYRRASPRRQALIDLLGTLFLLLPMCLFLAWNSWDYVAASWARGERSAEAGGLPYVYLQKSLILLLVTSLMLQALSMVIRTLAVLSGRLANHLPDREAGTVDAP
jgi:TRAP-type mannitol/chloroaromatic compound transport system permease small subunit